MWKFSVVIRDFVSTELTYDELIKLLDTHFDDSKNIMSSTYTCFSCHQKPGQTFADWRAELYKLARRCGFTTSQLHDKPMDRAIRDMLVIGVRNPKVRQALLKEADPDLATTEKTILAAERLESADKPRSNDQSRSNNQPKKSTVQHRAYNPCETYGSTQHLRADCRFRDYTCNHCHRTGHLASVCRQKSSDRVATKHITTVATIRSSTSSNTFMSFISFLFIFDFIIIIDQHHFWLKPSILEHHFNHFDNSNIYPSVSTSISWSNSTTAWSIFSLVVILRGKVLVWLIVWWPHDLGLLHRGIGHAITYIYITIYIYVCVSVFLLCYCSFL